MITPKLTHGTAGAPDSQFASEMRGKSHHHLQWDFAVVAKGYYCDVVAERETRRGSFKLANSRYESAGLRTCFS
jgi:hypothetical protein